MAERYGRTPSQARSYEDQRAYWDREYSGPHPKWRGPPSGVLSPDLHGRVLELGCGNGKTAGLIIGRGAELVAVDFSINGLRACRRSLGLANLEAVLSDVRFLPFTCGSFDSVVAYHVLGHLMEEERREAVSEVHRVLRRGGTLLLKVFSVQDMRFGQGKEVERGTFRRGTGIRTHFFEREELLALTSGFEEVSLTEEIARKRYGGEERSRGEWIGTFRRP